MEIPSGFEAALTSFIVGAQAIIDENYPEGYPENCKETLTADPGRRYVRIVRASSLAHSRSVHCFVDMTNGNVLKPASWKTPAKGARGNIFTMKSASEAVGPRGAHYAR